MMVVSWDEASKGFLSLMQRALPVGVGPVVSCGVVAERGLVEVAEQHVEWQGAVAHACMVVDRAFLYCGDLILLLCALGSF